MTARVSDVTPSFNGTDYAPARRGALAAAGGRVLRVPSKVVRKFDTIVEIACLAPFIDTPVKRYSSGMFVRIYPIVRSIECAPSLTTTTATVAQ